MFIDEHGEKFTRMSGDRSLHDRIKNFVNNQRQSTIHLGSRNIQLVLTCFIDMVKYKSHRKHTDYLHFFLKLTMQTFAFCLVKE